MARSFSSLDLSTKIILSFQALGMLGGTFTHVSWAVQNGFLSEHYNAPLGSMLFWDSLTFLDPLAAILLFVRPRVGVVLTALIIFADVLHNNLFYFDEVYRSTMPLGEWLAYYWMIFGQIAFGIFVFATLRRNLRRT